MPRKFHPSVEETEVVSLRTIAVEAGWARQKTVRYLRENSWWTKRYARKGGYDARLIDLINALHGRPHRPLTPVETSWLDDFLRGGPPHAQ